MMMREDVLLLMILQRYTFGSKSQPTTRYIIHLKVAYDIAKIYIWKQITTKPWKYVNKALLLMILQRYTFGSKSQPPYNEFGSFDRCLWYCKDIHLEANHNIGGAINSIFGLLMILQRYTFGSKSQRHANRRFYTTCCLWYCKDIHLEANHNIL